MRRKYTIEETGPRIDEFLDNILELAGFDVDYDIESGEGQFELSLNLKGEEWAWVPNGETEPERAFLEGLEAKARASGEDPAWLHVAVNESGQLPAIAKLLFARARRVQPPRGKKRR